MTRRNKYGVAPVADRTHGGVVFASKAEMKRWLELLNMERAWLISDLSRQVPYALVRQWRR